ncbi:hypothetical protein [Microbispora amethystogenes]|uniref:hypothetical protein n=1 Tax=Microbispora amethystogenes TaxID=1427754 RepID=UPI001953FCFB|nr:hypothetical protein [Microbispora amethystogenes]
MDIAVLADQLMPYLTAAAGAYGQAVAAKAQDTIADETVSLGRRLLQRIIKRGQSHAQIQAAITDLAQAQKDANAADTDDAVAALRLQVKKALAADPALAAELTRMLPAAEAPSRVTAVGERVAVIGSNTGVVQQGDNSITLR